MNRAQARQLCIRAGQPLPPELADPVAPPVPTAPSPYERKLEAAIHKVIMQWLDSRDWKYLRARMDKKSPFPEGWPDFTVFIPGRAFSSDPKTVFLEVKTPTGVLSEDQRKCIAELTAANFPCFVPRSDLEAINWIKGQAGE